MEIITKKTESSYTYNAVVVNNYADNALVFRLFNRQVLADSSAVHLFT